MTNDNNVAKEIRTAIKQHDIVKVKQLLGEDPSRLKITTTFGNWLHVAATKGSLDIVQYLIQLGAEINCKGGILGGNALNEAASDGRIEIAKYLLDSGAEMDVSDPRFNPLFSAIHGGHTALAKLLIDRGMDIRVKYTGSSMKNMDALAFAREWGRSDIAELIISHGG